ncbi:3-phosphoshikimate 1-carboxyvinyltransferase [Segetibacter sp. 3557_3]|uniref:3-phosphoshikimate 1-carboxyvinyltransferase n=1 Tax=Segetibacter sp. 3557_3 TaxID=2547429 RepID=UPI0010584DB7|nr:3-phosphoshikimate 1-carboxyvinyltransferase [Segetibacter sp. 3557_3]TDH29134.1 3-phosphoshikimate 1-carboxyvinyltransferase [Segetibacter sp. 3557_3]
MTVYIENAEVTGTIDAPASKSSMQRACAAALLAVGTSHILNAGVSNDDLAALDVITKLGATVSHQPDGSLLITSNGVKPVSAEINCGESGLGIRMFAPIAALSDKALTITGTGSLLNRPMDFFDEIFPLLNIDVQSNGGKLPIHIKGPLQPSPVEIDGSLSSQFLTGLLMAFGAGVHEPVAIKVNELKSKPYIDLTLSVMAHFGRKVTHDNYQIFYFEPQAVGYSPQTYQVEGDWSGAAFLLVAGAIAGNKLVIQGLDLNSTQADRAVLQAVQDSGANISIDNNQIILQPASLKSFVFDATDCPDLFPPLVALAAFCNGTTAIRGISRLTHKESNRAQTLQEEFGKLGVEIRLVNDDMLITGSSAVKGNTVHSRHDHRIAMACAVAGLRANGRVEVLAADAINKSYPDFFDDLQAIGAKVTIVKESKE